MNGKKGALHKLMEKRRNDKTAKPQTQKEYHTLSIKLFSKATSVIKPPVIEFKDDNDISKRESFHESILLKPELKRKYTQEEIKRAIKLFQNNKRTLSQNQFFIQFLMQLEPFNQIISESESSEAEDIIRLLSFTLKYEYAPSKTPIFKFGEYSNKFYLILNGQVDIVVPNEEEIALTEEEYFLYLLKLRQFNENQLLNKALSKNCNVFFLEEKNFDNWVRIAYNTLQTIKSAKLELLRIRNGTEKNKHIEPDKAQSSRAIWNKALSPRQLSPGRASRGSQIRFSPSKNSPSKISSPRFSPKRKNKKSLHKQDSQKKPVFDSNERKELILSLEMDIINAMKVIDPYFEDEFLLDINFDRNQTQVSTEEYINRTKPITLNTFFYVKRKKVTVSSYFLANRLYSGDKFGEMMNDVNQINSNNQRVSTLITADNCEFGVLDKEGYNKCLKDAYERIRKIKLNFLLQIKIFRKCNKSLFMKSFSNFFTKRRFQSQELLFTENAVQEDITSVYFIREGEFVAEWNKSLNDVNYIINALDYQWLLPSDDENKHNPTLEHFMRKKMTWKLQYFSESYVIGLNDALLDKKYLYTVRCSSNEATVYEIHMSFLKMVIALDPTIASNIKSYENIQRNLMIKLLSRQKKHKQEIFRQVNKETFENEFTYVKKRIIVPEKVHTTINNKCKRKSLIAFNKKRANYSIEDNSKRDDYKTHKHITNHTNFVNTTTNITSTNKDVSIKSQFPLIQHKFTPLNRNELEKDLLHTTRVEKDKDTMQSVFNSTKNKENISKTKDYCATTLESEPKMTTGRGKISISPDKPSSLEKTAISPMPLSETQFNPSTSLQKGSETKRDTIFNTLSKNLFKYNKNSRYYSTINPRVYLLK